MFLLGLRTFKWSCYFDGRDEIVKYHGYQDLLALAILDQNHVEPGLNSNIVFQPQGRGFVTC